MRAKRNLFLSLALAVILAPQAGIEAGGLPFFSVNATSVTLRWTAPGDDWNEGQAWQYDLRFSTTPITGTDSLTWWNASKTIVCTGLPRPGEPGTPDSFVVGGLVPGRTYYFVLRTSDEIPNWSFFSNVALVTTSSVPDTSLPGDDTPPAPVAGLSATPVPQGILLNWSPSPDPDLAGYVIYRGYSQGELVPLTAQLVLTSSYIDTELIPGATYFYAVTAVDNAGNESAVAQSASASAPSVPPAMTRLLAPFPDPCVKQTMLRFDIAEQTATYTLRIFDIYGRLVKDLGQGPALPGQYASLWDLTGDGGERVAPGVYFSVLTTEHASSCKKLLILK
jgi:hypothetical protein